MFSELRGEVVTRLVDIDGIIYRHYLNFLFIVLCHADLWHLSWTCNKCIEYDFIVWCLIDNMVVEKNIDISTMVESSGLLCRMKIIFYD